QILGNVEPIDLIHISRTTKTLRKVLLAKSARFIWLESFANIEFYRRKFTSLDHISEPRLAAVLFETRCNV
ncbi:hypothetical protein CYLTODRAFT_339652, partial [Cylindrobasidium torrendii FP15055 ss-10]